MDYLIDMVYYYNILFFKEILINLLIFPKINLPLVS